MDQLKLMKCIPRDAAVRPSSVFVHPSAHVDERAQIGEDSRIWINAQVRENAVIGRNCVISKDVYIDRGVIMGDNCKVQNSVSLYNGVRLENDVFVGPNACFTNDRMPRAFSVDWEVTGTTIERGASIGANATVVCGITIGQFAMIAAGAVVTQNVPPFALMAGNPARCIGYVDVDGNRVSAPPKTIPPPALPVEVGANADAGERAASC